LTDRQIRPALHSYLKQINENIPNTRIIDEFDLYHGCARVDVAVVNGLIHGYEIKSEVDSLSQLPNQIKYYSKSLEKITIVVAPSQLKKVANRIPDWWGILLVRYEHPEIIIKEHRESVTNPFLDVGSLLFLLWKSELFSIVENHQLISKKHFSKRILAENVLQNLSPSAISYEVCEALKSRKNWRS
jgi:hypothetical protein